MHTFQILTCFTVLFQNITFVNIITNLIKRLFKYWEAVKLKVIYVSQISKFFLKTSILSPATNTVSCFPSMTKVICEKMSDEQEKPVCQFLQIKKGYSMKKYLSAQLNCTVLFFKTTTRFCNVIKVFYMYFPFHQIEYF